MEIIRVRRGPDPDLIIRHVDGYHGAIAASWTSYASAAADALAFQKPPLLDLEGLCHLAYDTGNYVRLHSQGGTHHGYGFSSSQSDGLADTGLGTSLDRSAIADRPSLRATGSSLRACPSRACSTGKKGDL